MTTRKGLFAFISKQQAEKYSRIVRYCNIIRNTVSVCNDPDTDIVAARQNYSEDS